MYLARTFIFMYKGNDNNNSTVTTKDSILNNN